MKPLAYYEAIATLTGCIIGAGILGIPFVIVRAGFWTGMLVLFLLGIATLIIHLLVGEISLRSRTCHQLVGHAERLLGKPGKYVMTLSMILGVYGALIAYTLGISQSLAAIFGISPLALGALFYLLMAVLLYGGVRSLGNAELWMELAKFLIFFAIIALLFLHPNFSTNRLLGFSWNNLLIPYGVILFAYVGTAAIPEVREQMKTCPLLTKRAIIIGSAIPILTYALFTITVVSVSGGSTTEVASIGLAKLTGGITALLLHLFAIFAMATSFLALAFALKETYTQDFTLPHAESFALTLAIPLVLIALGVHSFVRTLELTGTFAGGITAILIVIMHAKSRTKRQRKPEYTLALGNISYGILILIFAIGTLYQLVLLI